LSFDHIGISGITAIRKAGTPTNFRKRLTASLRRLAATASAILGQSRSVVERLSSTMNGASYNANFLIPRKRFADSSARTAPEDVPQRSQQKGGFSSSHFADQQYNVLIQLC
jgi:hypothetical protein